MTQRRQIVGLSVFALLSAAIVFNALYLQGAKVRFPRTDAASPQPVFAQLAARVTVLPPPGEAGAGLTGPTETIAAIHRELAQRGYAPGPDGSSASPVLRAAILAFEADQGLPLTAEASQGVLQALILGVAPETSAAAAQGPGPEAGKLIGRVQRDLAALGYGPFAAPGRMSEDTARAIAKFERDQSMAQTSRISAPLVARLMKVAPQEPRRAAN